MNNDDFWDFSCAVYENLREPLLRLQDEAGLNVNMLLLCAWLGNDGYRLCDTAGAHSVAHSWESEFIAPLRALRRAIKPHDAVLYEATKRLELRFEHACQKALQAHVAELLKTRAKTRAKEQAEQTCIAENIGDYLDYVQKSAKEAWISTAVRAIISRLEN